MRLCNSRGKTFFTRPRLSGRLLPKEGVCSYSQYMCLFRRDLELLSAQGRDGRGKVVDWNVCVDCRLDCSFAEVIPQYRVSPNFMILPQTQRSSTVSEHAITSFFSYKHRWECSTLEGHCVLSWKDRLGEDLKFTELSIRCLSSCL